MDREQSGARLINQPWVTWAIALSCTMGSAWLYRVVIRLSARLPSAEPTAISEVLPWVKPLGHHGIKVIQLHDVGFGHLVAYIATCAALFSFYAVMVWLVRRINSSRLLMCMVAASAMFRCILLASPVMFSFDGYAYAFYGRLLCYYGATPHAPAPPASVADPFHCGGLYHWGPSWYGPFWTIVSAIPAWIGGGHVGLTLLLFRGFAVMASLGIGGLVWLISRRLNPEIAPGATILFLWNPLVVMESGLAGHNDGFMMLLALGAVWLHLRGHRCGAVMALTLSALVKMITAPLIPLYMLMILRESAEPKQRVAFLLKAGTGAAVAVGLSMYATKLNPNGLVAQTVSSAWFYKNNYHELIFRALRRGLGETNATLDAPMDYQPWWVATATSTRIHAGVSSRTRVLMPLAAGQPLLALSSSDSEAWLRVYDPIHRAVGFVNWSRLYIIPAPALAAGDPIVQHLSIPPGSWPTVATANRWIRLTTWGMLAIFGLMAAWMTRDDESWLRWSTLYFVAALLLVVTQIWPWYLTWPLAFGVLQPAAFGTRVAIVLTGTMAMSYAFFGFCNSRLEWLYDYRSIFTIILPVAVVCLVEASRRRGLRLTSRPATS